MRIVENMTAERIELMVDRLVKAVIEDHVEACMDIEPDRMEIRVSPWKPTRMTCPYGRITQDESDE